MSKSEALSLLQPSENNSTEEISHSAMAAAPMVLSQAVVSLVLSLRVKGLGAGAWWWIAQGSDVPRESKT